MPAARTHKLLYFTSPGDVIGTFAHWRAGRDDPAQVALTYSAQFFDLCQSIGAKGMVVSFRPGLRETYAEGDIVCEHRPAKGTRGRVGFQVGQILDGLFIFYRSVRWRADAVILSNGTHWFIAALLPLLGVKVIPTLHCVLWPKAARRRPSRVRCWLDGLMFKYAASAILSLSRDIDEQLEEMTGGVLQPVERFVPTYRRETFAGVPAVDTESDRFGLLYISRVQADKGVFDLLDAVALVVTQHPAVIKRLHIDLCGDGPDLPLVRERVNEMGLGQVVTCHGHVKRDRVIELLGHCHAVVVPTQSTFVEGFAKSAADGVLSGRPVIATTVVPAARVLGDAIELVEPDSPEAMAKALVTLMSDRTHYEVRRTACSGAAEMLYEPQQGWGFAAQRCVAMALGLGLSGSARQSLEGKTT
ncbi:MAG: glycosyltransferase family 4 protein [Planctomycetota bacterium]